MIGRLLIIAAAIDFCAAACTSSLKLADSNYETDPKIGVVKKLRLSQKNATIINIDFDIIAKKDLKKDNNVNIVLKLTLLPITIREKLGNFMTKYKSTLETLEKCSNFTMGVPIKAGRYIGRNCAFNTKEMTKLVPNSVEVTAQLSDKTNKVYCTVKAKLEKATNC